MPNMAVIGDLDIIPFHSNFTAGLNLIVPLRSGYDNAGQPNRFNSAFVTGPITKWAYAVFGAGLAIHVGIAMGAPRLIPCVL